MRTCGSVGVDGDTRTAGSVGQQSLARLTIPTSTLTAGKKTKCASRVRTGTLPSNLGSCGPAGTGGPVRRFIKRLRLAWAFKVWPWRIPANVVLWLAVPRHLTEAEIACGHKLAKRYGWERADDGR